MSDNTAQTLLTHSIKAIHSHVLLMNQEADGKKQRQAFMLTAKHIVNSYITADCY